jgi:ribonuclease HI
MPSRTPSSSLFGDSETPSPTTKAAGWINAHCDGGARGNPGPAGYGAQIVDDSGAVIAELSEFLGFKTNNFAEYSGLLGCLNYAIEHNHPRLRVVSDSELMVKQIQGKYQVKSPDLKPLFEEAKRRIAKLDGFQISHALRAKNKEADRLANEAMDRGMKRPPAAPPVIARATPYPVRAEAPPAPTPKSDTMLRGFTRDGVVHILGDARLPDGIFVKIIRE